MIFNIALIFVNDELLSFDGQVDNNSSKQLGFDIVSFPYYGKFGWVNIYSAAVDDHCGTVGT